MQKYWKGTRTLSACKSAFSHSELLQMKYIILTPLAFIQVTCPAHSLLSHKFRLTQPEADPFPTGGAWAAGTRRSGQRCYHDQPALGASGGNTALPLGGSCLAPEVASIPQELQGLCPLGTAGLSKLLLLFPALSLHQHGSCCTGIGAGGSF